MRKTLTSVVGLGVVSAFGLCSLLIEGHASAQNAAIFATPGPAAPALPASPAPALPAGCTAPTLANCQNQQWFLTDRCASSNDAAAPSGGLSLGGQSEKGPQTKKAHMAGYCRWLMLDEWRKGAGATHNSFFPTAQPATQETPLTPAKKIDRGRNVVGSYVPGKATERRNFKSAAPGGAYKAATKPAGLEWSPKRGTSNGGSWTSQTVASAAPITAQSNNSMEVFRTTGIQLATVNTQANSLMATLVAPISNVSSGPAVGDCFEYANKHWGDYTRFSTAAKRLGRNYRQVYNLAMTPSSPVFINKDGLVQTGTNTPMEKQIREVIPGQHNLFSSPPSHTPEIYANAFQVEKVDWLDEYNGIPGLGPNEKRQIKDMVNARLTAGTVIRGTSGSPLSVHENAKQRLDTVYGNPNDDELEDAAKRAAAYQKLRVQRAYILEQLECASGSDPCHLCSSPPDPGSNSLPGAIQKLKDRVTGNPRINPADINVLMQVGNPSQRYRSLGVINQIAPTVQGLAVGQRGNTSQIEDQLKGQGKLKVAPLLGDVKDLAPPPNVMRPPKAGPGINACAAGLQSKRPQLQIARIWHERRMAALLVNELKFGNRGCLENPGPNKTNLCDWNYELFGSTMATLMDSNVEASFEECRVEVTNAVPASGLNLVTNGFNQILKEPMRQGLVFPCVWRDDFTVNAAKAKEFMVRSGDVLGRRCEGQFQKGLQAELQAGITGAVAGLEWNPGEEKIGDSENDSMTLGDQSSLGAYATYGTEWWVKGGGKKQGGNVMDTCKFDGTAKSTIDVGVYFFGDDIKILKVVGQGDTKARKASLEAKYRDFESAGALVPFNDKTKGQDVSYGANDGMAIEPIDPPIYLGGAEFSFWVFIGPVPVRVAFGASAAAGINYNFSGVSGDNCSSAGLKGASNFNLGSNLEPYARGDAFASASVDVVVAEAGIRLDLLLLRVGLPIGLNVDNSTSNTWRIGNGARVSIDLLSGKVTAFASVWAPPVEASWEETLFRWDGFHTDIPIFEAAKTIDNDTMRIALAKAIDPDKAKCKCQLGSGGTKGFCCSDFSCDPGKCQTKTIGGQTYACNFDKKAIGDANLANACKDYDHGVPQ